MSAAEDRSRRAGGDEHSAAQVRIGQTMTSLLTEGLVARGHDVTLFATGDSKTTATLHAIFPHGYWHDANMWPWEMYEMLNLAAAVERAARVRHHPLRSGVLSDVARVHAAVARRRSSRRCTTRRAPAEVALWSRYPEAPFIAISNEQARLLSGVNVVGTVLHGIDTDRFTFRETPDDYLLFLGRFTEGKGVLQAIEVARRAGHAADARRRRGRLLSRGGGAARRRDADRLFRRSRLRAKVRLYGGARALLYPIQAREPFGLVLAEAMACGTPVAALDRGAVREIVDDGVTGDRLRRPGADGRRACRACSRWIGGACASGGGAVRRAERMVDEYVARLPPDRGGTSWPIADDPHWPAGRLAVFAHPDDESLACGGTLARLADAGVRVVVMCASRGERGSISDPRPVPDERSRGVRAGELRDAAPRARRSRR